MLNLLKKILKSITTLIFVALLNSNVYGSSYQLQMSELFQSCDFIHNDSYSLESISMAIKGQLSQKLEGETKCNASFNQLNQLFDVINKSVNRTVDPVLAEQVFNETYTNYLVNLSQEASVLDQNDPVESVRLAELTLQIDALKVQLNDNKYQLELNRKVYGSDVSSGFKKDIFSYSKSLFTALNAAPQDCIDELGGWDQIAPAVLKVGAMVGGAFGPAGLLIGPGLETATQLTTLLQNKGVKKAIATIDRRKNEQIIACTYMSLQNTACTLRRAEKFVQNKDKIKNILFRSVEDSQQKDYEDFYIALSSLPKIKDILQTIGAMGSAVTLNVDLISAYFKAIRTRPDEIDLPEVDATDDVLSRFILEMRNRGIYVSDSNDGVPISIKQQVESIKTEIIKYQSIITSVIAILKENRSFLDIHAELQVGSSQVLKEILYIQNFLRKQTTREDFPVQYRALFEASILMVKQLGAFLNVSYKTPNYIQNSYVEDSYKLFVEEVNKEGRKLFTLMSAGSVAQITAQTVLMIPDIAFERFERSFRALENFFLNKDLESAGDRDYVSFSDYMVNQSLQVKVANDYKLLSGSKMTFRLENYERTKSSFENGFKGEIKKMIKNAINAESSILDAFEGKTAAHMCALFAPFLKDHSKKYYKKCKEKYTHLELLSVLDDFKDKTKMKIEYNNSCFYSDYKREEAGQRVLFDRLVDYGLGQD